MIPTYQLSGVPSIPTSSYPAFEFMELDQSFNLPHEPPDLHLQYGLCPSRRAAALALGNFFANTPMDRVSVSGTSPDYLEGFGGYLLMLFDRAIVRVRAPNQATAERLLRLTYDRLWSMGMRPGQPFALQSEQVLSPAVNFATGQVFSVQYVVETDPEYYPLGYRVDCRGGNVDTSRFSDSPSAPTMVVWDGTDGNGNRVPDGTYQVSVFLRDLAQNEFDREYTVQVSSQPAPARSGRHERAIRPPAGQG